MKRITKAAVALVLALIMAVTPLVVLAAPQNESVIVAVHSGERADIFDVLEYLFDEIRPLAPLTPEAMEMALYDLDYVLAALLDALPTQHIVYRRLGMTLEELFGYARILIEEDVPMLSMLSAFAPERWAETPTDDRSIAADFMFNILQLISLDVGAIGHMIPQDRMMVELMLTHTTVITQFDDVLDLLAEEELEYYLSYGYTLEEIREYIEAELNFVMLRHALYSHPSVLWFYDLDPNEIDLDIDLGGLGPMDPNNITTAIIEEGYIAYFHIASFMNNMLLDTETLFPFFEEIQDFDHLIIDIRGNGGGWANYFNALVVSMLIDEPINFTSYEFFIAADRTAGFFNPPPSMLGGTLYDIVPAAQLVQSRGMTDFAPQDLALLDYAIIWNTVVWPAYGNTPFGGEIWLLVDGGAASASVNAALFSTATGFATVVGEPTSGITGVVYTYAALPNTGILFRMDIGYTVDLYGRSIEEFGVIPQIANNPGMDALQTVLSLIQGEGPAIVTTVPGTPGLLRLPPADGAVQAPPVATVAQTHITIDGQDFVWIRHMANIHGYSVQWNDHNHTVTVTAADGTYRVVAVSENGVINMYGRVFIPYELANEMFTSAIVGTWNWDLLDEWQYTFNNDGTGIRGMGAEVETFTWSISGNRLDIHPTSAPIAFGLSYDLWYFAIDGDVLVLVSRQEVGLSYTYYRA